ncbi:hypothetical protein B9G55_01520 [Saccharibacillus sp. O16]|nr:hypothetical protein B9G55_01520 [Saccharibacillus sp. O16]
MIINELEFLNAVPADRLRHTVEKEELECGKLKSAEMFEELLRVKPTLTEDLFLQYKYAGKTAVNIFENTDFPEALNDKSDFLLHIKRKLVLGTAIVGRQFRPEITDSPQLNFIDDLGDALLLQWVSGEKKLAWDGYETIERMHPNFEYMMIRFGSPTFVELRCGYSMHKKYKNSLEELLSVSADESVSLNWLPVTKVTEKEAEEISNRLNAGLIESEVTGDGCIGRLSLCAAPGIDDLKKENQYNEMVAGRQYLAQVFTINYREEDTGYSTLVKFKINHKGGFEFKSKVSERIIRNILDVFIDVRYGGNSVSSTIMTEVETGEEAVS